MSSETKFRMPEAGPEHALLKPFEGTFTSKVEMWMGPGDPMVSTGTMNSRFQIGGLYLHQEYYADPTDGPISDFEGRGYWGFNSATGKFEGFWIDNASTAMQMETGPVNESGNVWEMFSEPMMPGSGVVVKKRTVISLIDPNHHSMVSYVTPPESAEMKCMAIDYHRVT